jgi:hypothetical protein
MFLNLAYHRCYDLISMPQPTMFLIHQSGEIVEMNAQPYDSEKLLQGLLAKYPSVLAGDQTNGNIPRKWLFVTREAGIPDEHGGADRWSLDHIFIDANGVPTLVEVKRSTDTRIRREVVGQMLDYAANAVLYWPVETIRQRFRETCLENTSDADMVVAEFLGCDGTVDSGAAIARFWETVETNLRAGKIRLVFAADEIPPELRRVVEFLNEQMNPAEVLAIEIRQYVGTGVRTMVPTVIQSLKRATANIERTAVQWDRGSFIAALQERRGSDAVVLANTILDWAGTHCPQLWWGEGRKDGSCFVGIRRNGVNYYPFAMWTYGRIEMQFQWLQQRSVTKKLIEGLASRLNAIPGIQIPTDALTRRPSFELAALKEQSALSQFLTAIESFVSDITRMDGTESSPTLSVKASESFDPSIALGQSN